MPPRLPRRLTRPLPLAALTAAVYDRAMAPVEAAGLARRRRALLARATGVVLDVGAGSGANITAYRGVEAVVALEPHPGLRRRLEKRAQSATVPVEVVAGTLEHADLPEGGFDTVVCTLVLCSVSDQAVALDRIRRLLKPDGRLLFLEHVGAPGGGARFAQAVLDRVWHLVAGGCRLRRDTPAAARAAGLVVTDLDRFSISRAWPLTAACTQGVARPRTAFATGDVH